MVHAGNDISIPNDRDAFDQHVVYTIGWCIGISISRTVDDRGSIE